MVGALGMPESPITPVGFNTAAQLCCLWSLHYCGRQNGELWHNRQAASKVDD